MDDLAFASAEETAALVRAGGATAREVVEAALRRIEALDGDLNAFIEVDGERALAAADAVQPGDARAVRGRADRDQGQRAGRGDGAQLRLALPRRPPARSLRLPRAATARGRLRDRRHDQPAGVRDPADHRAAPHRRHPQPVGPRAHAGRLLAAASAAAVAAGMVPLAHGNDGGGSIRIPAACCGLVGLKPSRGRVSRGPDLGDSWLACDGVLTRTVADTAHALDVLGGYEVGDANWAPRPAEPYATADAARPRAAADRGHGRQPATSADVDPEACAGCASAAELLARARPRRRRGGAARGRRRTCWRSSSTSSGRRSRSGSTPACCSHGREPDDDEIEPLSRALLERAQATPSIGYLGRGRAAAGARARAGGVLRRLRRAGDAGAGRAAAGDRRVQRARRAADGGPRALGHFTPYTSLFNVTGQPAISVPVGFGEDGLPTGVQIVGKPLGEDTLLQLAAQIETARPWAHQRPPER